jgi:hypothetical protein
MVSLGIVTIATLVNLLSRTPETRFALIVSLLVIFAVLTLAPLVFFQPLPPSPIG